MKEEGDGVVEWGSEGHGAVHVVVVVTGPPRTLQVAKSLVIVSVTTLEKNIVTVQVCVPAVGSFNLTRIVPPNA